MNDLKDFVNPKLFEKINFSGTYKKILHSTLYIRNDADQKSFNTACDISAELYFLLFTIQFAF